MTRAELRRQAREKEKRKAIYTLTSEQIESMKNDAVKSATDVAFILMLGLPLMAIRDGEGYGKKRLQRVCDNILELHDSFDKGYITLDDVKECIEEETGVVVEYSR